MTEREKLKELFQTAEDMRKEGGSIDDSVDFLLKSGVIVLPCKIGDTVYRISSVICPKFDYNGRKIGLEEHTKIVESKLERSDISINEVYLTREQAEEFAKRPIRTRDNHRITLKEK